MAWVLLQRPQQSWLSHCMDWNIQQYLQVVTVSLIPREVNGKDRTSPGISGSLPSPKSILHWDCIHGSPWGGHTIFGYLVSWDILLGIFSCTLSYDY